MNQRLQRQAGRQLAQLERTLIRHGTAKAQLETQRQ